MNLVEKADTVTYLKVQGDISGWSRKKREGREPPSVQFFDFMQFSTKSLSNSTLARPSGAGASLENAGSTRYSPIFALCTRSQQIDEEDEILQVILAHFQCQYSPPKIVKFACFKHASVRHQCCPCYEFPIMSSYFTDNHSRGNDKKPSCAEENEIEIIFVTEDGSNDTREWTNNISLRIFWNLP